MVDLLDDLDIRAKKVAVSEAKAVPDRDPSACHICDRRSVRMCNQCDRPVCAADSWTMFGLCTACAKEERVAGWNKKKAPSDRNWLEDG